jgi:predicted nucleic acid-binding protein
MKPTVYIETSVISYLVARRNQRDLLVAANQELTREWWETQRHRFDAYVSAIVLAEAARGDRTFAAARLEIASSLPLIEVTAAAMSVAEALLKEAVVPPKEREDALHIAICAASELDYLLTWNCKHIANPFIIRRMNTVIRRLGYEPPLIYTPQELLEG